MSGARRFEFASRIVIGPGVVRESGEITATYGKRPFVVCGANRDRAGPVLEQLDLQDMSYDLFSVAGEPTTHVADAAAAAALESDSDVVVAVGGGSVLDTGKAAAMLKTNGGQALDYLEVVGAGRVLTSKPLPFIAVPTTAGPGSEATKNAVLTSPEHAQKASIRSELMLPNAVLIDPELMTSMPKSVTASTGLDALTQLIEPLVSVKANSLSEMFCRKGLPLVTRGLRAAYADGSDLDARCDMVLASLCGGIALSNASLGVVHGFAAVIGGKFDAPHGVICARFLPHSIEANIGAARKRSPDALVIDRYSEVAQILTGRGDVGPSEAIDWIFELCSDLDIESLGDFGMNSSSFPTIVEDTLVASSTKGNPIQLTSKELLGVVEKAV